MIFSQTQKQGFLLLISLVLLGYSIASFVEPPPALESIPVSPLLLEVKKPFYEKRTDTSSHSKVQVSRFHKQEKRYTKSRPRAQKFTQKPIPEINLNTADSAALDAIPGIGAKTAIRILKYKSLIGQFVDKNQLRKVYGISEENFQRMLPYFKVERVGEYQRKDLNGEKSYRLAWIISKENAALLVEKRQALGWFENWEQVQALEALTEEEINWLRAYYKI
jgi:DNA uptake protein ComE-like DNA-binding protein